MNTSNVDYSLGNFCILIFWGHFGNLNVWFVQIWPRHALSKWLTLAPCFWTYLYKLCVLMMYDCLHNTAPRYLQDVIQPVAEVTSRRRLRSASSSAPVVPATRRSSLGDRAFAVAGPRAWNSLPQVVTDCSSPLTFKKYIKTYWFSLCF